MLTSHLITYNCVTIKYPFIQSILSVLPISQEVIVVDCGSTDGTVEAIREIGGGKITIFRGHWGDKSEVLSEMTNLAISKVGTPFHMQIQADEVLHEDSYGALRETLWQLTMGKYRAAYVNYLHFIADFRTTFGFMYDKAVRITRTDSGFKSTGDAVQFVGPGYVADSNIWFYHYGKVHLGREQEAAVKEYNFQRMFEHLGLGFPDPLIVAAYERGQIDYREVFATAIRRGELRVFAGTHPQVMREYITRLERGA